MIASKLGKKLLGNYSHCRHFSVMAVIVVTTDGKSVVRLTSLTMTIPMADFFSNFIDLRSHNKLRKQSLTHCLRRLGLSMPRHRLQKKNRKKLRYFRLPPNLAHRKIIALANYVPSSSPLRVLSFTQQFFKNVEKWRFVVRSIWDVFA